MTDQSIIVDDVTHSYQTIAALSHVSFSVSSGDFLGLLGPNGSGKTTLFRLLSTLLPLQQGRISICGFRLPAQQADVRRCIGVTFQSPALDIRLTVMENLLCHAAIYGLSQTECRKRSSMLLERFQVKGSDKQIVGTLSGGMKRRVELARGFLHNPRVMFLDEPTTGLDLRSRMEFFQILREQQQEGGTTIVMATHLMEEAEQCSQLLLLDQGRVVDGGTPDDLKTSLKGDRIGIRCRDPQEVRDRLVRLIGSEPILAGNELVFRVANAVEVLSEITGALGSEIQSVQISKPSLEDVFLARTGRSLTEQENKA